MQNRTKKLNWWGIAGAVFLGGVLLIAIGFTILFCLFPAY
jgi:hypothetical protein